MLKEQGVKGVGGLKGLEGLEVYGRKTIRGYERITKD